MKKLVKKILFLKSYGKKIIPIMIFFIIFLGGFSYLKHKESPSGSNYQDAVQTKKDNNFSIAISPHHLVAKDLIEKIFLQMKDADVEDVIIISPNHFNQGSGNIQSSLYSKSRLMVDQGWIKKMREEKILTIKDESFSVEHGINNLLPYIEESFPNAKIIPIIISETSSKKQVAELIAALNFFSDKKARIILSADFSHYLTNPGAQFHNIYALKVLENVDLENISKIDVDCQRGLEVIMGIAKLNDFNFRLMENSNAAILSGDDFAIEPTSYITGLYSKKGVSEKGDSLNLSFFGNLVDGGEELDFALGNAERIFLGNDLTVANFESLPNDSKIEAGFRKRGFNPVANAAEEQDNKSYALIEYNQFQEGAEEKTIKDILNHKNKAKLNIVYANWKDRFNGAARNDDEKRLLAHGFVDVGADVVIGNSSFETEHIENYKGKYIFYSVGNFFDELYMNVGINYDNLNGKIAFYLIPMKSSVDHKQVVVQGDELKSVLQNLSARAFASDDIKKEIARGMIFD